MTRRLLLSSLGAGSARQLMLRQLRNQGFCCVTVDEHDTLRHLKLALPEAKKLTGFRFPPMEEGATISYSENQRQIFRALFRVATTCLGALLKESLPSSSVEALTKALQDSECSNPPFGRHRPHEPFQPGQPFAWTFFNLFNYQNGLLNPHVDRSLMTVIYSSPPPPANLCQLKKRSTLWIRDRHGIWRDGDRAAAGDDQVVVMVGEELQESGIVVSAATAAGGDLVPALHAVKVDPNGGNLPRPHFCPDPAQEHDATVDPRMSAALILRHDLQQEDPS